MEWLTVLKTKNAQEAEICKINLIQNQVNAVIFDKKDTSKMRPRIGFIHLIKKIFHLLRLDD